MQNYDNLIMKFPVILRDKLKNNEIKLPDNTEFEYENVLAYRCVKRKSNDNTPVSREDFKSNAELGRRNIRGEDSEIELKPEYYGVSLFQMKEQLKLRLFLPKKDRKIVRGYVYKEGGPMLKGTNTHICWWLYENVDLTGFELDN